MRIMIKGGVWKNTEVSAVAACPARAALGSALCSSHFAAPALCRMRS